MLVGKVNTNRSHFESSLIAVIFITQLCYESLRVGSRLFCQAVTAAYGASLVLFVIELHHLGTARTGAYYSMGPFFGAVLSFALLLTEFREAARLSPGTPLMTAGLAAAYARSGNRPEALKLLGSLSVQAQHEYVSPYYIAVVYAALGESNQALDWLDKAYADRSNGMVFLKMDPDLDPLRGNPRFKAIQKKLQFPES